MHNYLKDEELASKIVDIVPSDIFTILNRARKQGRSASLRHQLVSGTSAQTDRKAYSIPELRSMLAETLPMPISQGAIWWWRLFTGMRQSEILGAEIKNLHLVS